MDGWRSCGRAYAVSCSPLDGNSNLTAETETVGPINVKALQSEARSSNKQRNNDVKCSDTLYVSYDTPYDICGG